MIFKLFRDQFWASEEFINDLKKIPGLDEKKLKLLAEWFNTTPELIGIISKDIIKMSKSTGIDPNILSDILHVIRYILYHWHKNKISKEELIEDLKSIGTDNKAFEKMKNFFMEIEKNKERIFKQIETKSYKKVGIPTFSDLKVACDLRAVFEESPFEESSVSADDYKKIIDVVPMMIMKVSTTDEEGLSFQLSEELLKKFRDSVEKAFNQFQEIKQKYLKHI